MSETSLTLVVPTTGELLDLEDTEACLRVLYEIRERESVYKEAKTVLTDALSEKFSREGTKTLELEGWKATLRGGSEIVWDIEILEELRGLGLPEERMNALITEEVSYKVNKFEANRIAGANPEYAEVIERAQTKIPKSVSVGIVKV